MTLYFYTFLPNDKIVMKSQIPGAIIVSIVWYICSTLFGLYINYFDAYKNVYGELASEKMLQAYSAVISTALSGYDYLGQLGTDDFIVITNSMMAEKLAAYLTHAFDLLAQKFYTEQDLKQGYIMMSDDDIEETPVPIVTTSIALVSNEYKKYTNLKELMTDLLILHKSGI